MLDQSDIAETVDSSAVDAALARLGPTALLAVDRAIARATTAGSTVRTEHLLLGIAETPESAGRLVLAFLGLDDVLIEERIQFIGGLPAPEGDPASLSPRVERVICAAADDADKRGQSRVSTLNLMIGLLRERAGLAVVVLEMPGVGLERAGMTLARAFREAWPEP